MLCHLTVLVYTKTCIQFILVLAAGGGYSGAFDPQYNKMQCSFSLSEASYDGDGKKES